MLTRIQGYNPQGLSISKFPTNPYVLSLLYDYKCHTFRLLKKTDRKLSRSNRENAVN